MTFRRAPSTRLPTKDSDDGLKNATLFLVGARSLDGVTADEIARRYTLSIKRAEYMLTVELNRRARHG